MHAPPHDPPARLRTGEPRDGRFVAEMMVRAGGGLFEQLLEGVVPGLDPAGLLELAVAAPDSPFAAENALIVEESGRPAALALAFPSAELVLPDEVLAVVPAGRIAPVAAVFDGAPAGTLYLNTLAVRDDAARRGHARMLLAAVAETAAALACRAVSLHCWAANAPACALYARCGFTEAGRIAVAPTERLAGGVMLVMTAPVTALQAQDRRG